MFKPGMAVYLVDGETARYIAEHPTNGTHIVERAVGYYDGCGDEEEWRKGFEPPCEVKTVLAKPPVSLFDEMIADREKELSALEDRVRAASKLLDSIKAELQRAEKERKAILSRLKQNEALRYVDDWIEGRFEWAVVVDYGPPRVERVEKLVSRGEYRPTRLLSLLGESKGDLQWKINEYSDGSGTGHRVYLFKTEGEAKAHVQVLFDKEVDAWRKGDEYTKAKSWAQKGGDFVVPDDLKEAARKAKEDSLRQNLEHHESLMSKAKAELESFLSEVNR